MKMVCFLYYFFIVLKLFYTFLVLFHVLSSGFGFNITGGIDEPYIPGYDGCFITRIRPDGVAAKDGRLHVGDRVVSVSFISI